MSSLSLGTGLKALLSSRFVLDTVGHNLANANTPGYSRQRVGLEASLPLYSRGRLIGSGVDIGRVERSVDELLARRINTQHSVRGGLESRLAGLSELESFLGGSGDEGFGGLLDGFFTSVSDLAGAPGDAIRRSSLVQASRSMTSRLHELRGRLSVVEADAITEIRARVKEVNSLSKQVAALNVEIAETQSTGATPNDLLDRRDFLLGKLSELVDMKTIEGPNNSLSVLVAGNTLVGSTRAAEMSVATDQTGRVRIRLSGSEGNVPVSGGAIGGLLELNASDVPVLKRSFDDLAHELILSVNRLHSTGIPVDGPFTTLIGTNRLTDIDGDGKATDELLSNSGLPFEVTSGELYVNVQELGTNNVVKHRIDIDATHTTAKDLVDAINAMDHMAADVDRSGRLRIVSDAGYGFDFSKRLVPEPDVEGTFGGKRASLGTVIEGPYGLADGDTLTLTADPAGAASSFTITFDQADFLEISEATSEEIAAVINSDPSALANGIHATSVGDTLVLQTLAEGTTAGLRVDGGTAVDALNWTGQVGSSVFGHASSVDPLIQGEYTGDESATFTFRPNMDGVIGTTDGLVIDVHDEAGDLVASLDVGPGYVPGTELPIGDGVSVKFGLGEIQASRGDLFQLDLAPDSDTSDVLVALGINAFFEGTDASDIDVRQDIAADPSRIATSISGAGGDSSIMLDLLRVKDEPVRGLGGDSLGVFYGEIIGELGFQVASTADALRANDVVVASLEQRRDQTSGVDVDEELVDLVAFEQAFQAASRFITVVNELNQELLALI